MAEETPSPEETAAEETQVGADAADEASPESGEETSPAPRRRVPWLLLLALGGLCTLLALEGAGLLLRDRLEHRRPALAEAPERIGEAEGEAVAGAAPGSRFGPEVKEVAVGAADPRPPAAPRGPEPQTEPRPTPEPAARPTPAAAPQPAPEPVPAATPPEPKPAPAPPPAPEPEPAPETAPAASGSHALQVGIFGSQKYRHAMERQLDDAGVPHFRRLRSKQRQAYRLTLAAAEPGQREAAGRVFDAAGVLYELRDQSLEALFHFEEDARSTLARLTAAGLTGGYARVSGELPLWVVYAGPFDLAEAKRVRQQLAILGLPSYLRKNP